MFNLLDELVPIIVSIGFQTLFGFNYVYWHIFAMEKCLSKKIVVYVIGAEECFNMC
jgi:hypothetical protein